MEKLIQLIQHHARADTDGPFLQIKFADVPVVPREIHNQSVANRAAGKSRACAAWNH